MGPASMHVDETDDFLPDDFLPNLSPHSASNNTCTMGVQGSISTGSWQGVASVSSPSMDVTSRWYSANQHEAVSQSHSAMSHAMSTPSMGAPPMHPHAHGTSARTSTVATSVVPNPAMNHGVSSGWAMGHGGPSKSGHNYPQSSEFEERLNEIMHQSNAAMSNPMPTHMNFHSLSSDVSMDTSGMHVDPVPYNSAPMNTVPVELKAAQDSGESRVLTVAKHCPPNLLRSHWSVSQFKLLKILYKGNNSRVLKAIDSLTGMTVALKVYNRKKLTEMEKYQVAREIRMHSELLHDNIIRLYCAWKDANFIHVAEEYAPHGDIYSLLKPEPRVCANGVPEPFVLTKIFRPLLSALSFIHSKGLIHRDLKPENILLGHENIIKLTDFGLSINSDLEVANTRLGTINYIAPEILKCPYKQHPLDFKDSESHGYDNKVDIWSLGVLAYELLTADLPFSGGSTLNTLERIMRNQVVLPSFLSPLAKDFISRCLQSNPSMRPSVDELRKHAWVCQRYDTQM